MALPSDTATALTNDYNAGVAAGNTGLTNLISSQNAAQTQTKADLNTQYGIPDLTNQIQGYKDTIRGIQTKLATLPTDVASRDKGTLTNQAMLNRQTTAEAAPMQTNMSLAGIAEAPLNDRLTSAQNDITQQMAMLSDQQAREMTGYTTNNQNTLNAILDKLNNQRTLDATEAAQANALAVQQKNFEDQQALNKQQTIDTAEAAKAKQANDLALQQQSADLSLRNSNSTAGVTAAAKATADKQTKIDNFNKDLQSGLGSPIAIHGEEGQTNDKGQTAITREVLIKRLQLQHPDIDPNDISRAVYDYYAG
jgi:hypothetical protein